MFFKVLSPNNSKRSWGQSHEKYLGWWWPGVGVGSISHKPLLFLSGVEFRGLHYLPEWPVVIKVTNRAVFSRWVESLLQGLLSACKAPRGRKVRSENKLTQGIYPPLGLLSWLHDPWQVGTESFAQMGRSALEQRG